MKTKIIRIFIFIFLGLLPKKVNSQSTYIKDHFDSCILNYDASKIPRSVKREIKRYYKVRFVLANPNEKYQSTDVVVGWHALRERRLIFWARCVNDFVLIYEHGGYGHHIHIILFSVVGDSFRVVKNLYIAQKPKSLEDIKSALTSKTVDSLDHF
jgi:hypothetical protein